MHNPTPEMLKEKIEKLKKEFERINAQTDNETSNVNIDVDVKNKNINLQANSKKEQTSQAKEEAKTDSISALYLQELEDDINFLLKENSRLKEDRLKAIADGENLKKRVNQELQESRKYYVADIIERLLPVLDNFQRALKVDKVEKEVKSFLIGFEMIMKNIEDVFTQSGVKEIIVNIGDEFDGKFHQSINEVESTEVESGKIIEILQKGYTLNERVLRATMVNVAK